MLFLTFNLCERRSVQKVALMLFDSSNLVFSGQFIHTIQFLVTAVILVSEHIWLKILLRKNDSFGLEGSVSRLRTLLQKINKARVGY